LLRTNALTFKTKLVEVVFIRILLRQARHIVCLWRDRKTKLKKPKTLTNPNVKLNRAIVVAENNLNCDLDKKT